MKTISMPLEEYENEKAQAKHLIETRSYNQGAMDALRLVRNLMTDGMESTGFTDPDLQKLLAQTVSDINEYQIKCSITCRL